MGTWKCWGQCSQDEPYQLPPPSPPVLELLWGTLDAAQHGVRCVAAGGPCGAELSSALAGLPACLALGCLASFPHRPGAHRSPWCRETGQDTCAPLAAAPSAGALRVPAIVMILSRVQRFLPLSSLLVLARGGILSLPSCRGRGCGRGPRCTQVCSAHTSCWGEDMELPGMAVPPAPTAPVWAPQSLCMSPNTGRGTPSVPLGKGCRVTGWTGDGCHHRCSLFGCLRLIARLTGVS